MRKRLACILALTIMLGTNFVSVLPSFALTAEGEQMEVEEGDLYTDYDVSTWQEIANSINTAPDGFARLNFTGDIIKDVNDPVLKILSNKDVILNLNDHTLSLLTNNTRGLQNYGTLTIMGNGVINNGTGVSSAYGLIDNYGSITIENGTFIDYGEGNGSSIKIRPGYDASLIIEAGAFEGRGVNTGNACVYSDGVLMISDGVSFTSASNRAYAVIVNSGWAEIGETVGAINNPVIVDGTHGGLGINSGEVVVNNGVYSAKNYYGIWITNNNNVTDVDIKYAEAYGAKYGLYSSVDDGKQDLSDVGITIAGGKYSGGTRAAVAINGSNSEHSFGMKVSGGEFSTKPDDSYIDEGYVAGLTNDEKYPYMVVSETDEEDAYDVEYEEDEETGEEVPVIYPSRVEYGHEDSDDIKASGESDYEGAAKFNEPFIADRQAHLEIKENNKEVTFSNDNTSAVAAFDIALRDRNENEIEVKDTLLTVRIELTDEQYEKISGKATVYVAYVDDDGKEVERIEAKIVDGKNGKKMLEFETTHLSTFVLAYEEEVVVVEEDEAVAVAPETGTVTAAGASAMGAALVTAIAVGVLTSVASFTYLVNRKY